MVPIARVQHPAMRSTLSSIAVPKCDPTKRRRPNLRSVPCPDFNPQSRFRLASLASFHRANQRIHVGHSPTRIAKAKHQSHDHSRERSANPPALQRSRIARPLAQDDVRPRRRVGPTDCQLPPANRQLSGPISSAQSINPTRQIPDTIGRFLRRLLQQEGYPIFVWRRPQKSRCERFSIPFPSRWSKESPHRIFNRHTVPARHMVD